VKKLSNNQLRSVMEIMRDFGWFEYGAIIPADDYRELLGIKYPEKATKREFDSIVLTELSYTDFIRSQLLNEGKFLKFDTDCYRILLPSENKKQIENYMQSAQKKLSRAIKLGKNTPAEKQDIDKLMVRAHMKKDSIKSFAVA